MTNQPTSVLCLLCFSAAVGAASCAANATKLAVIADRPARIFEGLVVHHDGSPAAGVLVTLSNLDDLSDIATVKTDESGHFRAALTARRSAATATSPGEVAYVRSIDLTRPTVPITLDNQCLGLTGQIEVTDAPAGGVVIHLARLSEESGDWFAAELSSNGHFNLCVPPGHYYAVLPSGYVQRLNITSAPQAAPLTFRTATRASLARSVESNDGFSPIASFTSEVSARVLAIGESNHGTREFSDERTRLALELARQRKLGLILIEAGYGEALMLDRYIGGEAVDIKQGVQDLGYWPWDTYTFIESLDQLKQYNLSLDEKRRIHIVGIDVQSTIGAVDQLTRDTAAAASRQETASLVRLRERHGEEWKRFTETERSLVRAALERIAGLHDDHGVASKHNRDALAARSLSLHLDYLEAPDEWASQSARDAGMSRMVLDVIARQPESLACIWAHLGHVAREDYIGSGSMGAHLTAALGTAYQVYGMFASAGAARAWDPQLKVGVTPHTLPSPPAGSVEATLTRYAGAARITYWRFDRATGGMATWLHGIHLVDQFGATYPGDRNVFVPMDLLAIDGAILLAQVTPSVPTPSGARLAPAPSSR
jgi:erythromycin esterase